MNKVVITLFFVLAGCASSVPSVELIENISPACKKVGFVSTEAEVKSEAITVLKENVLALGGNKLLMYVSPTPEVTLMHGPGGARQLNEYSGYAYLCTQNHITSVAMRPLKALLRNNAAHSTGVIGIKMSDHIVADLTEMIRSSFDKGETIELATLLWSIDAKHRLIPEVSEINSALSSVSMYKITRNENQVCLTNEKSESIENITKNDIEVAMARYNSVVAGNL